MKTPILIAGGGPVGLTLALELQYQGVPALLVERNIEPTRHPKLDITNGRSMELFRRLGVAQDLRAHGVAPDCPMQVVFATALGGHELARFSYPSTAEARAQIHSWNDGRQALEPCLRISQTVLERVLQHRLARARGMDLRFGWALESFTQSDDGVAAVIRNTQNAKAERINCQYLVGCDGAGSVVRQGLGIALQDISVLDLAGQAGGVGKNLYWLARNLVRGVRPLDGRIYMIHFESKDPALLAQHPCWHLMLPGGETLISQNENDIWTMHIGLRVGQTVRARSAQALLYQTLGRKIACKILLANVWRPRLSLAQSYGHKRVWLAGDSAHQYIPTGGYGMNTGVADAVGLGWKLAARIKGWGHSGLLAGYAAERRSIGERNRAAAARHMTMRAKLLHEASPAIAANTDAGAHARARLGGAIARAGNLENEAWGIEYGYRYSDSPIICADTGLPPPNDWAQYTPTSWPGGRPPSLILEDGTALFDKFDGRGFTLLCFRKADTQALAQPAKARNIPLRVLDLRHAKLRKLYERDFVLVRPDQIVAWRGNDMAINGAHIWDIVCGARA